MIHLPNMRPRQAARPVAAGRVAAGRVAGALRMALALCALVNLTTPASAQASNTNPVRNVRVCDVYARSVVLRWDAPLGASSATVSGYNLVWRVSGTPAFESKTVAAEWTKPTAVQLQPLDPTKTYSVSIYPLSLLGKKGAGITLDKVQPKGTYEAELKTLTNSGKTGFLYLPELDPIGGRVNLTKLNNDFYGARAGSANGTEFDHSSVAVNNQQHWHMILNDLGTGSITSRVKGAIHLADGGTRQVQWDCDRGPFARQTWYIVLTPNKVEQFLLFPNNGDTNTTNVWPREQIMLRFGINDVAVYRYSDGNLVSVKQFNWRGDVYTNVRQRMGLKLNQSGLTFLADTDYNGSLEERGSFLSDLSGWKECYMYFTFGSYNNKKFNTVLGTSATGVTQAQVAGGNMHWGNIAFSAPANKPTPVELSFFHEPNLARRASESAVDISSPLPIMIAQPIPNDAVARELVFTDRIGCIPCLTGRDKLVLKVNGVKLPNKFESQAWQEYPTYRWSLPAGVLRSGLNYVSIGQTGAPDPISIMNVHIDLHVPPTSTAIAAYVPPPAHPILDTMPNHTELEGWVIPELTLGTPDTPVKGALNIPITASAQRSAYLAGNFVAFDRLWVTLNNQAVWSLDTNADGLGSLAYQGTFTLDTTRFADGYYEMMLYGRMKGGAVGWNNGSSLYNFNANRTLIIHNKPATTVKPTILSFKQTDQTLGEAGAVAANATTIVKPMSKYIWEIGVASPTLLSEAACYLRGTDGTYKVYNHFSLHDTRVRAASGNAWQFKYTTQVYNWMPRDKNGLIAWKLVVRDVDGNVQEHPFVWSPVQAETTPPPVPNSAPVIKSLEADPLTVKRGWSSQLRWSVSSAEKVMIDSGIGTVSAAGKVCITPTQTTTYTLTATNKKGTTKKQITITVVP